MLIEHAKIIRKLLKKHFPGVKFSVVSSRFSGGDAIHIHPKSHIFDPELHRELYFAFSATSAGQFDGMTDSYNYYRNRKFWGAKYVSFDRAYGDLPTLEIDRAVVGRIKDDPDYKMMME